MAWESPEVDLREIGEMFKQRRTRLGLYKTQTAQAAGMSVRHYNRIEAGDPRVSERAYYAAAAALGIPDTDIDELIGGTAA